MHWYFYAMLPHPAPQKSLKTADYPSKNPSKSPIMCLARLQKMRQKYGKKIRENIKVCLFLNRPFHGTGTKFLITKFLSNKVPNHKVPNNKVPK